MQAVGIIGSVVCSSAAAEQPARTDAPYGRYTVTTRHESGSTDRECMERANAAMAPFRALTIVFRGSFTAWPRH